MEERTCVDCGAPWVLSDNEIRFYVQKFGEEGGLPKRCQACRDARRARNAARGDHPWRQHVVSPAGRR